MDRYFYGTDCPVPVWQPRLGNGKFTGLSIRDKVKDGYSYYMCFTVRLTEEEELGLEFVKEIHR